MKKIIKTIIALMSLAPVFTAAAAVPDNTELRHANLAALSLVQSYGSNVTVSTDEKEELFRNLFKDGNTQVYNDLLGLAPSRSKTVSVDEYVKLLKDVNGTLVDIRNIRSGAVEDGGDCWLMTVNFDKSMFYVLRSRAILRSSDYYGVDYKMTAQIEVAKDSTHTSVFRSIDGKIDSKMPPLEPEFRYLVPSENKKDRKRDTLVTVNGKPLRFNKSFQAFLPEGKLKLSYPDPDMKLKLVAPDPSNPQQCKVKFTPRHWRLRPYYDMALDGAYTIDAPEGFETTSSGMDAGLDIGYCFGSRKFRMGIFFGAGISTGKFDISATGLNYNYSAYSDADMDGEDYQRYYEIERAGMSVKTNHIAVPLYLEFEIRPSRRFSIYLHAGAKGYLNMGSKIENADASLYSYGIYPQHDNLRMDESWLNGFGDAQMTIADYHGDEIFNSIAADAMGGLGLRLLLFGPLSLDVGATYMHTIINRINDDTNYDGFRPEGQISQWMAPVTYTVSGGQVYSNLLTNYCKIKTSPLRLHIGLTFKF